MYQLLKWFHNLNVTPRESEINLIWKNVYDITNELKLREFQWKLLHRLLPCNKYLYFWKIKDTMLCSVCQEIDSLEHRFLNCSIAVRCWTKAKNVIKRFVGKEIEISPSNIIFTECNVSTVTDTHRKSVQFLILVGKWSIHKYWIANVNVPIETVFKNEFNVRYNLLKEMHLKVDILHAFERINRLM